LSAPHPIHEEDLELLALGLLGGEECQNIRAHVSSCEECARKLAEARGRVALFSLAAPAQNPPPVVREGLLDKIRSAEIPAEKPALADSARSRPLHVRAGWWNTIWVPATAVLAIATVLLWITDRRIDDQLRQLQQQTQTYEAQARHAQALVSILAAQDTKTVSLSPTPRVSTAWASVKYNSRMGMICYTGDLPAPPPHKEYQMWIVPMSGSPVSAGAFMPASFNQGRICMAKMPEGITCKSFAVTVEPMGGMPHPTGPMVLTGAGL
jgi:anti-sigma-K factor RskA